jgi:hypothetical protein
LAFLPDSMPLDIRLASYMDSVSSSKARVKMLALSGWKATIAMPDAEACGFKIVAAEFFAKSFRNTTGGSLCADIIKCPVGEIASAAAGDASVWGGLHSCCASVE